jgi:hypothetical protein
MRTLGLLMNRLAAACMFGAAFGFYFGTDMRSVVMAMLLGFAFWAASNVAWSLVAMSGKRTLNAETDVTCLPQ